MTTATDHYTQEWSQSQFRCTINKFVTTITLYKFKFYNKNKYLLSLGSMYVTSLKGQLSLPSLWG